MNSWTALVTLALVGAGCQARVDGGAPGSATSAIAMRAADLPAAATAFPVLPLDQKVDPDALLLFFASEDQACSEPVIPLPMSPPCNASMWQTVVIVPPDLDQPGVVNLSDSRIVTYASSVVEQDGDCSVFGAGATAGGGTGTLQIVSVEPASLSVVLGDGVGLGPRASPVVDGEYTVHRCDAAPAPGG